MVSSPACGAVLCCILTHVNAPSPACSFVQSSLEEDLSHVVGLSLEFWVVIVLFVLMAGPWGFFTMIFMAANGAMLIITNGKLAKIIRTVTHRELHPAILHCLQPHRCARPPALLLRT